MFRLVGKYFQPSPYPHHKKISHRIHTICVGGLLRLRGVRPATPLKRTNYQTNRWNTCITWRARRSSCSDVIVPERYASYNALIFFVNDIILRSLFGRRATHFRLADCRSSGAFLTFEMFYNYEKARVSSPHSLVETRACHDSTALLVRSCESTEYSLVPRLTRSQGHVGLKCEGVCRFLFDLLSGHA